MGISSITYTRCQHGLLTKHDVRDSQNSREANLFRVDKHPPLLCLAG